MDLLNTTIMRIFKKRVEENGDKTFVIHHTGGAWKEVSWREYDEIVMNIACGLLSLGTKRGDGVCIMSETRAEWGMADLAILSVGALTGAVYPSLLGRDAAYIAGDIQAKVVFAGGARERDELLKAAPGAPNLKHIIVFDDIKNDDPRCMGLAELIEAGRASRGKYEKQVTDEIHKTTQDDPATVIYTSGTTGIPKGALHTHRAIVYTATNAPYPFEPDMVDLSYLPMAHVFERFGGFFGEVYIGTGSIGYFRGDLKGIVSDFMELKPHVNRTAPRLLEKLFAVVKSTIAAQGDDALKDFEHALDVARKVRVDYELFGVDPGKETKAEFEKIIANDPFALVHQYLGGRMKFFYGGGAPIPKEVTEFYFAAGVPVYELYGTTETIGTITNYPGMVKPGTIGVPFPRGDWPGGMGETRLAADGEIENRGPNVLVEYLNKPDETTDAFTSDGWFMTGDVGEMDADGFIAITGRKKDIIITAGGKNIAPQKIENRIRETGWFSQAMVYGDGKKYLTALLTLDPSAILPLAGRLGIELEESLDEPGRYREVAKDPRTREFVASVIEECNRDLFKQERIVDFILLERDLSIEHDEITPTMKLKKKNVVEAFRDRLDALYDE